MFNRTKAKALVATAGAALTASLGIFPPNSTAWNVAMALVALLTAVGVHQVPNAPKK